MFQIYSTPQFRTRGLHHELDRLFTSVFHFPGECSHDAPAVDFPVFDVTEEQDRYVVEADLPGVRADDLEISAEGRQLTIGGKWATQRDEGDTSAESSDDDAGKDDAGEKVKYLRRERASGSFQRVITLPEEVDAERIEAQLRDGVLTLSLPKVEALRPRKIEVRTN